MAGEDDDRLWKRIAGDVRPLKKRGGRVAPEISATKPAPKPPAKTARPKRAAAPSAPPPPPPPAPPELTPETAPGLDRRTQERLRRGQAEIEGRIDLHGMRQAEAEVALARFLKSAHAARKRVVLVITGKGTRADGGIGAIRAALPGWLNAPDLRPLVVAFRPAHARHGGAGAWYVVLKRKRAA
jgi:DNA-nicking Smr family endonuclease